MSTESERANSMEKAAFLLLMKMHQEAGCGNDGDHWAECDALVEACGYGSWEGWKMAVRNPR